MHLTRDRHFPRKRTICSIFSMSVNKDCTVEEVLKASYPHFLDERARSKSCTSLSRSSSARATCSRTTTCSCVCARRSKRARSCAALLSEQYRYIMVDEYQDTNRFRRASCAC
jgi:DNA helicase-2/ATP-dependent DNA helicase PcrA